MPLSTNKGRLLMPYNRAKTFIENIKEILEK
jgi:hypothetical protein